MPVGHTLATLPQTENEFHSLWCLLQVRSSSGQLNTTKKKQQQQLILQESFVFLLIRYKIRQKEVKPGVFSAYPDQATCPLAGPPRWRKNREGNLPLSGPELNK